MEDTYKNAYQKAKRITKQYGTSYYLATRFFPDSMRYATYALYAFFRIPDEYVDNPDQSLSLAATQSRLDTWIQDWEEAYTSGTSEDPILAITAKTFHEFSIPYQYSQDFLQAMKRDLTQTRYQTYQELQEYMYGSASVVGLMMSHIIGFEEGALPYAAKLGEAMQMTNFLRDIAEDYHTRNRIYLPLEDLHQFGVTEEQIAEGMINQSFRECMQYEIQRTRLLYREAEQGIPMLASEGRFAVTMASRFYEAILGKIEEADYDIFKGRVRTTKREKLFIISKELKIWK